MTDQKKVRPRQVAAYQSLRPVMVDEAATVGAQIGVNLLLPDGTVGTIMQLAALFGSAASSNSGTLTTTDDLEEGQWNLWFTNRRAQDAVGGILADSANVTLAYVGGTSITADLTALTDSGAGALLATTFDAKGRKTGSRAATITGTAGRITVANGDASAGLPTIDLATVTDAGGGTLQRFVRDAWGRIMGTSAATTTDLTEGANLYFTAARVLGTVLTGLSTATNAVITAADSVLGAIGKLQAQIALKANDNEVVKLLGNIVQLSDSTQWRLQANRPTGSSDIALRLVSGASFSASDGAIFELNGSQAATRPGEMRCLTNGAPITFAAGNHGFAMSNAAGGVGPTIDNQSNSGSPGLRWKVVYAVTSPINTSDAREKTSVAPLTDGELAAAYDISRAIGTYQWLASVAEKGDAARHHAGLTVQSAIAIMQAHGLDPFSYGFICYDSWGELPEVIDPETGEVTQAYRPAGDRYSFRHDELLLFIARGLDARLAALEAKTAHDMKKPGTWPGVFLGA